GQGTEDRDPHRDPRFKLTRVHRSRDIRQACPVYMLKHFRLVSCFFLVVGVFKSLFYRIPPKTPERFEGRSSSGDKEAGGKMSPRVLSLSCREVPEHITGLTQQHVREGIQQTQRNKWNAAGTVAVGLSTNDHGAPQIFALTRGNSKLCASPRRYFDFCLG
ncbi:unnamed protein product, partial [Ectocarpus sp. 12 AP-2014]